MPSVFEPPGYFRSRPSAAGGGYDATSSGGTNLGPTNKKLVDNVKAAVEEAKKENPGAPVPIDLVTSSASGLDPHISPAAAEFQVPRVARERKATEAEIRRLVDAHTAGRSPTANSRRNSTGSLPVPSVPIFLPKSSARRWCAPCRGLAMWGTFQY